MKTENTNIEKALDDSLDVLLKSLGVDADPDKALETDLNKSVDEDKDDDDDDKDLEKENYEQDKADEDVEKSFAAEFASKDDNIEKALEVSEFLETLVSAIGESIDGFGGTLEKSFGKQGATTVAMAQAMVATGQLVKSLCAKLDAQDELIKSFSEQLDAIAGQPVGRKSIVNQREAATLQKSFGVQKGAEKKLQKKEIVDLLLKSFDKGEISGMEVTKFETSGILDPQVAQRLGIEV